MIRSIVLAIATLLPICAAEAAVSLPNAAPLVSVEPPGGWQAVEIDDHSQMYVAPDSKGFIVAFTAREDSWDKGVDVLVEDYKSRGFVFDEKPFAEAKPTTIAGMSGVTLTLRMVKDSAPTLLVVNAVDIGAEKTFVVLCGSTGPNEPSNTACSTFYSGVKKLN